MIIIFEGPDKSGKTALRESIRKARKHKDVTLDRFFGSMIVYGCLNKRQFAHYKIDDEFFTENYDTVLVYCVAEIKTLIKRMEETKHSKISRKKLVKTVALFHNYFLDYEGPKICINTTHDSIERSTKKLVKFINKIEKQK